MNNTAQELAKKYHVDLYGRYPITLTQGRGARVWDAEGREYLDALAGIAVNSVGHCHPRVVEAIREQAGKLMHVSNFYYNEPQSRLARELVEISGLDKAFFCNSGAEAVEGAVKLARKYASLRDKGGPIISMKNCFHGRTLGAISMGKKKYQKGFDPLAPGFTQVPMNDLGALEKEVSKDTVAIILETVQGEGGIRPVQAEYLQRIRELCDEHDIVMILDEIQCGIARSGKMFAYEHYGIVPDIVASAKALGGGFPIGAVIARGEVADAFSHGEHGTTYGGNPLACAASLAALQAIEDEQLAEQAGTKGSYLMDRLRADTEGWEAVREVRGLGLMIGVELDFPGGEVVEKMMERGVLSNCASGNVMRLVPPLVISEEQIDILVDVLLESIKEVESYAKA